MAKCIFLLTVLLATFLVTYQQETETATTRGDVSSQTQPQQQGSSPSTGASSAGSSPPGSSASAGAGDGSNGNPSQESVAPTRIPVTKSESTPMPPLVHEATTQKVGAEDKSESQSVVATQSPMEQTTKGSGASLAGSFVLLVTMVVAVL